MTTMSGDMVPTFRIGTGGQSGFGHRKIRTMSLDSELLLHALGYHVARRHVRAELDGQLDLVPRYLAFILHLPLFPLETPDDNKGNLVTADLPLADGSVPLPATHGTGEFFAVGFEGKVGGPRLSVATGVFSFPLTVDLGG